ncbi:MAG: hypothetical protein PVG70_11810 [Desulfobacterales bacterium]|jgi:hypothetical protein
MKKLLWLLLVLLIGCVTTHDAGTYLSSDNRFSVEIPEGWRRLETDKYLMITKDGPFLQYALIQQRPTNRPFRYTRKSLNGSMLPQEAAGLIIDELASDRNLQNFHLIENAPVRIDGHEGFRILFSYNDKKGSTFKTLYCGFVTGNSFYNIRYSAAMRHYFDKDLATFEQLLGTFKVI